MQITVLLPLQSAFQMCNSWSVEKTIRNFIICFTTNVTSLASGSVYTTEIDCQWYMAEMSPRLGRAQQHDHRHPQGALCIQITRLSGTDVCWMTRAPGKRRLGEIHFLIWSDPGPSSKWSGRSPLDAHVTCGPCARWSSLYMGTTNRHGVDKLKTIFSFFRLRKHNVPTPFQIWIYVLLPFWCN